MRTATVHGNAQNPTASGHLVATDGRELPLKATRLRADACAGLARVVVEQTFTNPFAEPLTVTYALPLPHAGAVSGFSFRIGDRRVVGEIDRLEAARERFEAALIEGRTAALLEQDRGSLFHQEVGNVPPGMEVIAEVTVDQPLEWLPEGAWAWRFPTVVAPRYLGAPERTVDADRVQQAVIDGEDGGPTLGFTLDVRDPLRPDARPESPTHAITVSAADGSARITLQDGADTALDRDLVVRWPVARETPSLALDRARPDAGAAHGDRAYGLLTVTPPRGDAPLQKVQRDLILLIDTSGSMSGPPLAQAKAAAKTLVESLGQGDTLELVAFASRPERWLAAPVGMSDGNRRAALAWIDGLETGGGTEMVSGMLAALRPRRSDAQRQVVLITDGLIGFEGEVVATICNTLPADARLHSVGVGPASNQSLTAPCARAGRGIEVQVGQDGDVEGAMARLLARLQAPVVTGLAVSGSALEALADPHTPDLFLGAPTRIPVALRPEGGELVLRGSTPAGPWSETLQVPETAHASGSAAVTTLFGREQVEALELELAAGADRETVDAQVERTGLQFAIATRRTSWIAVSEARDVDPREPLRRVQQPQRLPQGLSAEGLGLARFATPTLRASLDVLQADPFLDCMHAAKDTLSAGGFFDDVDDEFLSSRRVPELDDSPESSFLFHPPERRRVHAEALPQQDGSLLLEIEVDDEPLDWLPPESVERTTAVDILPSLEVVQERTSRAGRVSPGARIRLCLRLPGGADPNDLYALHLTDGNGEPFDIVIKRKA
jgi:Ca-activated chloride channel family protein